MTAFFWGMFAGAVAATAIGMLTGIAAGNENVKAQVGSALTAAWLVVLLTLALAFGVGAYQGNGSIQVIPPTSTPFLGR